MATIITSINSFRAIGLYPLNINEIPDCAYATAEITGRSEAEIMNDVAGHLNNNHQPESNNDAMPVQPEGEDAIVIQPDVEIRAIVRPRQEGENATTTHQKEPEEDTIAISSSTNLLRLGTNMDSLEQNLDGPELGETSFKDILPFPTIGKRPNTKEQKLLTLALDCLQARDITMIWGHTLIINKKANEKCARKKSR